MSLPDSRYIKAALLKSMLKPGKILLVIGGTILMAITEVFWLGVGFLGFYGLLVWNDLSDERFISDVTDEVDKVQLDLPAGLSPEVRPLILQFARTRLALLEALKNFDATLSAALHPMCDHVEASWTDVKKLARDADEIALYLKGTDPASLQERISKLEDLANGAHDAQARRDYGQALDARREELANYRDLRLWLDRVNAQLEAAVSAADSVLSKLMKMRLSGAADSGSTIDEVSRRVEHMASEIDAFEKSLAAVAGRNVGQS